MAEGVQLSALQTNLEWARASSKAAPIGCAVASAHRSGSTTPFTSTVITVAGRDHILVPNGSGLGALQVASPLALVTLPLAQYPADAQMISMDAVQMPLTAGGAPAPVLAVALLTAAVQQSGTASPAQGSAEKEAAPRCQLHFYGLRAPVETLAALVGTRT